MLGLHLPRPQHAPHRRTHFRLHRIPMRLGPIHLKVPFHSLRHVMNQTCEKLLVIDRGQVVRHRVIEGQLFRRQIQLARPLLLS